MATQTETITVTKDVQTTICDICLKKITHSDKISLGGNYIEFFRDNTLDAHESCVIELIQEHTGKSNGTK